MERNMMARNVHMEDWFVGEIGTSCIACPTIVATIKLINVNDEAKVV